MITLLAIGLIVRFPTNPGVLVVGFTITVLGSGASITLRSFLAASVNPTFSARLLVAISTIGTLGALVDTPIVGAVYSRGIKQELWNIPPRSL
jgi:hypothetical protein